MSHLTDPQFEEVLQGALAEPEHLRSCIDCQARLSEARVLRNCLRTAFGSLHL